MASDLHDVIADLKRVAAELGRTPKRDEYLEHGRFSTRQLSHHGGYTQLLRLCGLTPSRESNLTMPKVLLLDIETAPIIASVWKIFDETIGINQIQKDWHLLSWAAKWENESKVFYEDQSSKKDVEDDKKICLGIWKLIDEADVIVGHNIKRFDIRKLNARFFSAGLKPPAPYKVIDTYQIARSKFGFTSNKLEWLLEKFGSEKKLTDRKFHGFKLWRECLKGNKKAWAEMKKYNIQDVIGLEEIYKLLVPWQNPVNPNLYHDELETICRCGSKDFEPARYITSSTGRFSVIRCKSCGELTRGRDNEIDKHKRKIIRSRTT